MAQFARPVGDLDNTGVWTTEPLWSDIDDGASPDGTVVVSDSNPTTAEPFTVDLATITDPAVSAGHVLRIRWAKNSTGAGNKTIRIELREGYVNEGSQGTLIATDDYTINSTTLRTDATTLAGAEADAITDYADLQIRIMGVASNRALKVDFAELETPDAALTIDGAASDRMAPRATASAALTVEGPAAGRAPTRSTVAATLTASATASDRALSRAASSGLLRSGGTAAGRAPSRSSVVAALTHHAIASDRAVSRAAALGNIPVTVTATASDRAVSRAAAVGAVAVPSTGYVGWGIARV